LKPYKIAQKAIKIYDKKIPHFYKEPILRMNYVLNQSS